MSSFDRKINGSEDDTKHLSVLFRSKYEELGIVMSRILNSEEGLQEKLQKYEEFESWSGIGVCPLCRTQPDQSARCDSPIYSELATTKISNSQSQSSEQIDSSKLKLRTNQKRKRYVFTDNSPTTSPESHPTKKQQKQQIEIEEEFERPTPAGRILVPETCPKESLEDLANYDEHDRVQFIPNTVQTFTQGESVNEDYHTVQRNDKRTNPKYVSNPNIVQGHGMISQIESLPSVGFISPNKASTQMHRPPNERVTASEKSDRWKIQAVDKVATSPVEDDNVVQEHNTVIKNVDFDRFSSPCETSTPQTQIRASHRRRNINPDLEQLIPPMKATPKNAHGSTLIDESSCLFDDSSPKLKRSDEIKSEPESSSFCDEDDWLSTVKEDSERRQALLERRALSELKLKDKSNLSINTPSPSVISRNYRQQSIVGLFVMPKVDITQLKTFNGGALSEKENKIETENNEVRNFSPLKLHPDGGSRSPVCSGGGDKNNFNDILDSCSQESDASLNLLDLKPDLPKTIVRQNDQQDGVDVPLLEPDSCLSEKFGPAPKRFVDNRDSLFSELETEKPPVRKRSLDVHGRRARSSLQNCHEPSISGNKQKRKILDPANCEQHVLDNDVMDNDVMSFDDVMDELDAQSQADHFPDEECIPDFRIPQNPYKTRQEDVYGSLECSFDRVPKKKDVDYVYVKTDRRKAERQKMSGYDCHACIEYYGCMPEGMRCKHVQEVSRHRAEYVPPSTPPSYWSTGFPSTQERNKLQKMQPEEEERPTTKAARRQRKLRMQPANHDDGPGQ